MLNKRRDQSPTNYWQHRGGQQTYKFNCNQQQQHISDYGTNDIRLGAIGSHLSCCQSNGKDTQGFHSLYNASLTFGNFIDLKKFDDDAVDGEVHCRQHLYRLYFNERHVMNTNGGYNSTINAMRNYRQRSEPFWQPLLRFNDIKDELRWERDWNRRALDVDGNDRFLLEIDRGLSGGCKTRYPRRKSRAFHLAAQNYAVHGCDFFDFPHYEHNRNASQPPKRFGSVHRGKMCQSGRYHTLPVSLCQHHIAHESHECFEANAPATFNLNSASFPPLPARTCDDQLR